MKLSLVFLLLGAAAAKEPLVFGRGRSRRMKRSSKSTQRIWPKASTAVASDDGGAAKSTSGLQAKSAKAEGVSKSKAWHIWPKASKAEGVGKSKASKLTKSTALPSSGSGDDAPAGPWSKTSKRSKMSAERFDARSSKASKAWVDSFDAGESMSYDLSFSYDFSMPADDAPTTATPPGPSSGDDPNWGPLIFQFLSQCTGIELPDDSCLASTTIDALMAMDWDAGIGARVRGKNLELDADEGECGPPRVTEEMLRAIMGETSQQCEDVSEEKFNSVLYTFMRLFSHKDCWEALCGEGDDISKLFLTLLFDQAAECAGVDLDVDECVLDHVIELILDVDTPTTRGVRRVLEQEEDPCDTPSEADLAFFVSFMLIDAEAECSEKGVDLSSTDWNQVSSDLVTIFASSECWGSVDCNEQSSAGAEPSSADYNYDENESRLVVTDDGSQCIFEMKTDSSRDLLLTYYYQVETTSNEVPRLAGIEDAVQGIEAALIETICSYEDRARRLEHAGPEETIIVSVDSAPKDVVTDYVCTPEAPDATGCFVVEGKTTLTVEGESTEYEEEITMGAYEELEQLFALLPGTLTDPNVVGIHYLGKDPPATVSTTPDDNTPTIDKLIEDEADDSSSYAAVIIATSGGLVAMAMIITGFHRMSKTTEEDTVVPDEKPGDDASNDGQSTAYNTADLTYANSCDRSDGSYLPSPARSMDGTLSPYSNPSPAKFFVVAEEEEQNWRELSILPALAQDDGTLEGVSEEGEFIGDIRSTGSSCEMSV